MGGTAQIMSQPISIAPDVWWVGKRLADDAFQCHAYLIDAGDGSVLIDPGSPLTIEATLAAVAEVMDPLRIQYLVCHHPDPDIAAALPYLSTALRRDDVVVVTEWRARALLKHYGHRFGYWLIEEHDWRLDLGGGRALEFQLTPYLHFPGAFMSYDTGSGTLFSSDIFGGFVAEGSDLVAHDLEAVLAAARPFHQHYMPSSALLTAGLERVRERWPGIQRIAPQHGHVIPGPLVQEAFDGLESIACGVFALSDADHDLKRLLRLAEAKAQLADSLLTVAEPAALVASLDAVVRYTHHSGRCSLYVDLPDEGWTRWSVAGQEAVEGIPASAQAVVELEGSPVAMLDVDVDDEGVDVVHLIRDMAASIRPAVDQFIARARDAHRIDVLRRDSQTDPLTGLRNRRALDAALPAPGYSLISLDIDWFKRVNDTLGHASGDVVLRAVADRLRGEIRAQDRAYRLGGEEFLIVLPKTDGDAAVAIAERVRNSIARFDLGKHAPGGSITVSAGVAACDAERVEPFDVVLARADAALYASKDLGRDRVTFARGPSAPAGSPQGGRGVGSTAP